MSLHYNRLRVFWMVMREGTLRRAAERLHVSEPAVSAQIKKLEAWMAEPLFRKEGRRLVATELGRVVYDYADRIFTLGEELTEVVRGRGESGSVAMRVGVTQTLPKMLVEKLLAPAFDLGGLRIEVGEGDLDGLVAALALHEIDLVLSDRPVAEDPSVRVFSHRLGRCGVAVVAAPPLKAELTGDPVEALRSAPWLLPAKGSPVRWDLDRWFAREEVRPRVIAEFHDSALMKAFGGEGRGVLAVPAVVEAEVCAMYDLEPVVRLPGVEETFYAVTVERKITHPGVAEVLERAAGRVFEA